MARPAPPPPAQPPPPRRPPSTDALARSLAGTGLPHPLLVDAARRAIAAGDPAGAATEAERLRRGQLQPVINATGVLLHTNLGRAPLAIDRAAAYANLELDLDTGERGTRQAHAGPLLARACGAEAALVVNNGAAAVLLALAALASGRGVAVSRGELIEIGGGFRIPDVLERSGARLVEVGTTNRTRLADYTAAVGDPAADVALVLKVHTSNYRIEGFTAAVGTAELAGVGPPVVADLGSGLLDGACPWLPGGPPAWLAGEPAARQTLAAGAALVTFSGDKLLAGPQAGVVAGRRDLVDACGAHPLYRALRPGSLVLEAMAGVATAYLDRSAHSLPFWRMATAAVDSLRARAEGIAAAVADRSGPAVTAAPCASVTGGGTLPGVEIPSWGVHLSGDRATPLRHARPVPVVATVREGSTHLDLRTVEPADDEAVVAALARLGPS
ncbi:MAG TPA: L-seryl-tRNA(Sec) selenium transferase [Acidimicrobiales bacterium]|nr:L-seryl-tRNA(Sec) selenium transferase [Acidimicrobiales bacterium]